tara:strand:+ start:24525 stop:25436 length:912 start_codon:yes stop_codon:yes gene_type:complete
MHILMTGGTGFVGEALREHWLSAGHELTILSRSAHPDTRHCRYVQTLEAVPASPSPEAVVNLAGASLAGKRWTAAYKKTLVDSRVDGTRALVEWMSSRPTPPRVLLNASAIGFYGPRGSEPLEEDAAAGSGFASELCQAWEAQALELAAAGVRVCLLRLGVVLDADGGAFVQMAQPFRMGIASWPGDGRQYLSWVHRADAVAAFDFLLQQEAFSGPVNVTAPQPVTQRGFCVAMRQHFRTLPGMPVPGLVMRLLLGEMADELLLTGQRVIPRRLQESGFLWRHPDINSALEAMLDRHAGDRLP